MTMTKADLIHAVGRSCELSASQADAVVNTFTSSIVDALNRGEEVELRGFGSFRIRERAARVGRNPRTGASVNVPPKAVSHFKVGKLLKKLINS